jgi:Kef-type K+ transport system membrane component KefB
MHVLVSLAAILLLAFLVNLLFKKLGFSSIIGQICAGMILGIPVIKALLFDSEALSALDLLSTLGIVFLLFLAGLEIELKKIKETSKDSVLLALGTTLVPLTLGIIFLVLTVVRLFGFPLQNN